MIPYQDKYIVRYCSSILDNVTKAGGKSRAFDWEFRKRKSVHAKALVKAQGRRVGNFESSSFSTPRSALKAPWTSMSCWDVVVEREFGVQGEWAEESAVRGYRSRSRVVWLGQRKIDGRSLDQANSHFLPGWMATEEAQGGGCDRIKELRVWR